MQEYPTLNIDVLKVGHHGSNSSSSEKFIKLISPTYAVISCGKGNSYGHPHSDTLAMLNKFNVNIYRTDEVETVVITSDGNSITVDKKSSPKKENAPPVVSSQSLGNPNVQSGTQDDNQSKIVYKTKTGKKYHREGCSYLKSKIAITLQEAQDAGLSPCSVCKP